MMDFESDLSRSYGFALMVSSRGYIIVTPYSRPIFWQASLPSWA